ncbi:MAG: putative CRISPR-associated protein [Nitrospirota bacterium]
MNALYLCPSGLSLRDYIKREKIELSIDYFLQTSDVPTLMKASAEINSLLRMGLNEKDRIVFLSSDTDEGESVARNISEALKRLKNCDTMVKRIIGLQTDDMKKFDREGIPNLTNAIINEIENNRYSFNIVLNATAGFKATVPYLTFIGMIFHLPICYIFERSESIIELPPIPIEFDLNRLRQIEPVIDSIMNDYMPMKKFQEKTGLSYNELTEALNDVLLEEDGYVTLRPTGRILYQRYLLVKGNKVYISPDVSKKLESGCYDKVVFENLFKKFRDPLHLQSKIHNEIKKSGKIDLDCYKAGSTSERIFYYTEGKSIYICNIFLHDEYERLIEDGELLKARFKKNEKSFKEIQVW